MWTAASLSIVTHILLCYSQITGSSLWCYQCGTEIPGERPCDDFSHQSSWSPYWRECPDGFLCTKTLPYYQHTDETVMVRGCSAPVTFTGSRNEPGCWSHPTTSILTCYCDTQLCNRATTQSQGAIVIYIIPTMTILSHILTN